MNRFNDTVLYFTSNKSIEKDKKHFYDMYSSLEENLKDEYNEILKEQSKFRSLTLDEKIKSLEIFLLEVDIDEEITNFLGNLDKKFSGYRNINDYTIFSLISQKINRCIYACTTGDDYCDENFLF